MSSTASYPDVEVMVPLPQVDPYCRASLRACPACGIRLTWLDDFISALKGGQANFYLVRFCGGGKEPVETCGPGGVVGEMLGRQERTNPCAGISHPHLHLRCNRCGFERLLHTARTLRHGGLL